MSYAHAMSYDHSMSYDHTISYAYPQCLFISDDIVSLRTCGANKHYAQGPARKHTSFTAIIENDDFFSTIESFTIHCAQEVRGQGVYKVQITPSQACIVRAGKLRAEKGYDPPKRHPTCFSWHPRSVQRRRKGAQPL